MAEEILSAGIPIPEQILRDASKNLVRILPNLSVAEPTLGVKDLNAIIGPILDTADSTDLVASHRAATCNIICAIIEKCQAMDVEYVRDAILSDEIWFRVLNIYLSKSDGSKGKSSRQMLVVLTSILLMNQNHPRYKELQERSVKSFLYFICHRQDRLKVKPALQGLAYYLQKDIVRLPQLIEIYSNDRLGPSLEHIQALFAVFVSWIVHHDTSLSSGHLIKNFLAQVRRQQHAAGGSVASVWMQPVISSLKQWPDRVQEFKTNVFPHCFQPDIGEYLQWLSFLHFGSHMPSGTILPDQLTSSSQGDNSLETFEEFRILLASIETGKELGIVRDVDYRICRSIEIHQDAIQLPDDVFGVWMSSTKADVRLAGVFLSIYSTAVKRPITGAILKSLQRNLIHLHTDTDANFRRELLSYTHRLLNRLRGSNATLARVSAKSIISTAPRLAIPRECFHHRSSARRRSIQDPLIETMSFVIWYIQFLEGELRPDASYQRRISALRALVIVLKSGLDPHVPHHLLSKSAQGQLRWVHGLQIPNAILIRLLLDLVLDPFDDIREAAVSALHICLESLPENEREKTMAEIPRFIARAEKAMLSTGRADHADGVARAYALYFSACHLKPITIDDIGRNESISQFSIFSRLNQQLEDTLDVARRDLHKAVDGRPVHGIFAAIRYIVDQDTFYPDMARLPPDEFQQWKEIHGEIFASFESFWQCVQNTLCADAPEGHVPEELEEETSLDTKEILSYSWRGLKEASVLLRAIVSRAPVGSHDRDLISADSFERLGTLCFTQLIELRHRGAFSTVAQTFAVFCRRCMSVDDKTSRRLPERWYEETLLSIRAKANTITRRSGGIPALMAGIIAAEPQPGGQLFPRAMRDLIAEASIDAQSSNIEESRLPQVHAFNCIKEIFMTSRLSAASEAYIGDGLELAARTLNSKIWPIRNCSLMLFKALIERLLGSDEVQDWKEADRSRTSRFSYNNYPNLVHNLKSLLDPEGPLKKSLHTPEVSSPMDLHGAEGVFPALQILRQASPPEEHRDAIITSIIKLFGSPHWHLRDMAARTATTLHRPDEFLSVIKNLLSHTHDSANARHGALLCAKYMMRKLLQNTESVDANVLKSVLQELHSQIARNYLETQCLFVKGAFLDLVNLCGMSITKHITDQETMQEWVNLTNALSIGPAHGFDLSGLSGDAIFQSAFAQVFFTDRAILRPENLGMMMSIEYQSIGDALLLLEHEDPDTCLVALDTLHDIISLKSPRGPIMQLSLVLLHVYHLIRDTKNPEVLSKAQNVLFDGLYREGAAEGVLDLIREDDIRATLDKLEAQCVEGSPALMQSALCLLGFFLDWAFFTYPAHRHDILERIARYVRILRMTIIETNPFDTRFAAVQSMSVLTHIWMLRPTSRAEVPILLGLAVVLYDGLNDDDDEIRDAAALSTWKLLQMQQPKTSDPAVPMLMSHRLAKFLIATASTSPDLCKEALRRLINIPPGSLLFTVSFADRFAEERKEDTVLFNIEKQNLYKDETLDAIMWSRVLAALPQKATSPSLLANITNWVLDALSVLISTAREEVDGALGWCSKPEVFTLGMRVLCAAEVVLKWEGMSGQGSRTRRMLQEFSNVGKENEVHGLWLQKVDSVLAGSIVEMLRSTGETLAAASKVLGAQAYR